MTKFKKIYYLLVICIVLSLLPTNSIFIEAGTNDVLGIDSGKIYYIRNAQSGLYLDVSFAINQDGQEVIACAFNGNANQKWKVNRNSNGTYTLVAVFSSNGKVLDVTGTKLDIYAPNFPNDQQFKLTRHTLKTGDCQISIDGKYLIQNKTSYTGTTNYKINFGSISSDVYYAWAFELVEKKDADIYSFKYGQVLGLFGYDSTGADSTFKTNANNMSYYGYAFPNYTSAANALTYMHTNDSIWVHNGHGAPGRVAFCDSSGNVQGRIFNTDINTLPTNKLANLKVFITTGCQSGRNTDGTYNTSFPNNNLVLAVYEQGARFALGFRDDVDTAKGVTWIKNFFIEANKGKTVGQCQAAADQLSNAGVMRYWGDFRQKLK